MPQLILFPLCIYYTITHLEFHTGRSDLVGANRKYQRNLLQYRKEFQTAADIVTVVESGDSEKNRQFVERLGARLEAEPDLFTSVFYKGDLKLLGRKALLFIDDLDQLKTLRDRLRTERPLLEQFAEVDSLDSLFRLINRKFRSAQRDSGEKNTLRDSLPALERVLELAHDSLVEKGIPPSPGIQSLLSTGPHAEEEQYITFAKGRIYLVSARPRAGELKRLAVRRVRALVKGVQAEVPGVNVGVTGKSVLEFDEMLQSRRDTATATVVSLVLVTLIFVFGYQETGRPIKATLCLVGGLAYTMGYTTLVVGHLNILTIAFVPMLVGLAIDFGVHLITRYEEELRSGVDKHEALRTAMTRTGQGIFTGSLTTAGAFFAMAFTDFQGVREMGLITGGGILLSLIPMMTVLPVLLLRGTQNLIDERAPEPFRRSARIEAIWLNRPFWVIGVTVMILVAAFSQLPKLRFDYNLLHMQTRGLPAVLLEHKLIQGAEKSVLFGAVVAGSIEEAKALEARILRMPSVASVDSMAKFLGEVDPRKRYLIASIRRELAGLEFARPPEGPIDLRHLSQTLTFSRKYFSLGSRHAEKSGKPSVAGELAGLMKAIEALQTTMATMDPGLVQERLSAFQRSLFGDIHDTVKLLAEQETPANLRVEDLPPSLRERFVGRSGEQLLQVYPKRDVWERKNQEEFVRELRTLDPAGTNHPVITGTPVQLFEYTELLKKSYEEAAWYALAAISLILWVHFGSLTAVMLALLPVAVGGLWLAGLMAWLDIPFNPANIMTLPLVVGIGVTNGIHVLNRCDEEGQASVLCNSTGKAVLVSGLTTMAGFGSLMLARHRGIESLGYVMTLGVGACMMAGLTFLPCLLKILRRRGWEARRPAEHAV